MQVFKLNLNILFLLPLVCLLELKFLPRLSCKMQIIFEMQ